MKRKIYILGNIPAEIDVHCEAKFSKTQIKLIQMGYEVFNPIDRLINCDKLKIEAAKRKNIVDLMSSNAIYIMPCVALGENEKNFEIKLALNFNLTVVLGFLDLNVKNKEF